MSGFYDLDELKAIPIESVCQALRLEKDMRNKGKYKAFGERTGSLHLYNSGGQNRFCDFGRGVSGDTIALVAHIENMSYKDAIEELAGMFGIEPIRQDRNEESKNLTNWQWEKVGIYGDLATKNMEFSFDREDSMERNMELSTKYRMSMNELREKHPSVYKSILYKRANSYVFSLRQEYFYQLHLTHGLMEMGGYKDFRKIPEELRKDLVVFAEKVQGSEHFLKKALDGTGLRYPFTTYDVDRDWNKYLKGNLEIEIGTQTAYDMEQLAKREHHVLIKKEYDLDVIEKIQINHKLEFPYAAKQKGDHVEITVEKEHASVFEEGAKDFGSGSSERKPEIGELLANAKEALSQREVKDKVVGNMKDGPVH